MLCHFLGVAAFAAVDIEVETLRLSRRAESMRVSMRQDSRPILEALVWAVDNGIDGLDHDVAAPPQVPGPNELSSVEVQQRDTVGVRYSFFDNFEERPISWVPDHEYRLAEADSVHRCWYRFRPTPAFADHWVDAGRLAIVVDTFQWPATSRAYAEGSLDHIALSLDLACRFHRMEGIADAEWLLVEARAPIATEGLVGGTAAVWDEQGRLLASGGQQMLCRPAPT